jgi:hypothetical protein
LVFSSDYAYFSYLFISVFAIYILKNADAVSSSCLFLLGTKQEDGKYKHTVDLPKTTFGLRANSVVREPELQKLWEENQVLKRVSEKNTGVSFFIILDQI